VPVKKQLRDFVVERTLVRRASISLSLPDALSPFAVSRSKLTRPASFKSTPVFQQPVLVPAGLLDGLPQGHFHFAFG
jgi:hypothetical protein